MTYLQYSEPPAFEFRHPVFDQAGVCVKIRREDSNHPYASGNKWWKLKYNLIEAATLGVPKVLTFGGAYSNHIYATAAATHEMGISSVGIIRGEETLPLNPTLSFALSQGMELFYLSRDAYRRKDSHIVRTLLEKEFGEFLMIPEGGTNVHAVKGCCELANVLMTNSEFDTLVLPVGTGGTMAGMIAGFEGRKEIVGVPVLKNSSFLESDILKLLEDSGHAGLNGWRLLHGYDHGGYAKTSPRLLAFIDEMKRTHSLPLDHVYTGKMLWAVFEEANLGRLRRGSTYLVLHTGGLQGLSGLDQHN